MDNELLEETYYYHTLSAIVDLLEQYGYVKVLKDIVTILSGRSIDNTDKQE